jgi:hypothetical protein
MQVGSAPGTSAALSALQTSAQDQYQDGSDFSFALTQAMAGQGGATSPTLTLAGDFQSSSVYAVGTVGADGQVNLFSQEQIQQEQGALANARKLAYANALQNFLTLAQATSPTSEPLQASSLTDEQQFVGDNGLISASFTSQLSLQPGSGGD